MNRRFNFGVIILALSSIFVIQCSNNRSTKKAVMEDLRPLKPGDLVGTYAVTVQPNGATNCDSAVTEPQSIPPYISVELIPHDDSDDYYLGYRFCADSNSCENEDVQPVHLRWNAGEGVGIFEHSQASYQYIGRYGQGCQMTMQTAKLLPIRDGLTLSTQQLIGASPLEGHEICSSQLVEERRSTLSCVHHQTLILTPYKEQEVIVNR